jgi:hypothetical protein
MPGSFTKEMQHGDDWALRMANILKLRLDMDRFVVLIDC